MYRNELIATNIRRIKAEKGLKSKDIAERVGIQTGRMAKYERGELNVSVEMEQRFCAALGCEPK